jgi:enamine deaminase RidA (YjgF/YER057c/UK114 family)
MKSLGQGPARGQCAWTCIGVEALAHPALLLEIKCVAVQRRG